MPNGIYAQCPQCGKTAYGEDEIEDLFGFRYDGAKPQSWCRSCRSSSECHSESLSLYEAAEIWKSYGMDEDYMFGYSEEELRDAL